MLDDSVFYWDRASKRVRAGSVTDPHTPQEEQFERTKALLEQLRGSGAH